MPEAQKSPWFELFEQHTKILRGVGDLLHDVDRLMAQRRFEPAHKYNAVGTETSAHFDSPEWWSPGWFMRFYGREDDKARVLYVAVFLHDRGGHEDYPGEGRRLENPIIVAGMIEGIGDGEVERQYWNCKYFFWAGGTPNGQVVVDDYGKKGNKYHQRRNSSFGWPLDSVGSLGDLEGLVVKPLLTMAGDTTPGT